MGARLGDTASTPRVLPRRKTFEPVVLTVGDTTHRAHMLNLSAGGACLHARCTVSIWNSVVIALHGRELHGRVSWVAGDRFGVRFVAPLSEAELDAIVS